MRFKIASPRLGSTSGSHFLGDFTMPDETSREHLDQMALSLGRVIITCSILEDALTTTIAEIMSLNEVQERSLVRPMTTSVKILLLNRIAADFLNAGDRKRVSSVTKDIKAAAEQRNDLVHGLFVHSHAKKTAAVLSFSGSARLTGKPTEWTPRGLELLIGEMNDACGRLAALRRLFPKKISKAPGVRHSVSRKRRNKRP